MNIKGREEVFMTQVTTKQKIGRPAGSGTYSKRVTLYFSEAEKESVATIMQAKNANKPSDQKINMSEAIRFALNKTASELSELGSDR